MPNWDGKYFGKGGDIAKAKAEVAAMQKGDIAGPVRMANAHYGAAGHLKGKGGIINKLRGVWHFILASHYATKVENHKNAWLMTAAQFCTILPILRRKFFSPFHTTDELKKRAYGALSGYCSTQDRALILTELMHVYMKESLYSEAGALAWQVAGALQKDIDIGQRARILRHLLEYEYWRDYHGEPEKYRILACNAAHEVGEDQVIKLHDLLHRNKGVCVCEG